MKTFWILIFCSCFLCACGAGSGEGLDASGQPIGENNNDDNSNGDDGNDNSGVSLQKLVEEIFDNDALGTQRCTNCHSGASPLGGLNLQSVELAYSNLVGADGEGVTANGNAAFKRVEPGMPDESYLILKLEGDPRAGNQMPLNETPLSQTQINMVRDWIANGAMPANSNAKPTVISKVARPAENRLHLRFSRPLLAAQNPGDAMEIYFIENDTAWMAARDDYEIESKGQDVYIKLRFPQSDIDGWRIEVNARGLPAIYDSHLRAVDGDNNNQEGGMFRYEYRF